jgi:hypothetical protein
MCEFVTYNRFAFLFVDIILYILYTEIMKIQQIVLKGIGINLVSSSIRLLIFDNQPSLIWHKASWLVFNAVFLILIYTISYKAEYFHRKVFLANKKTEGVI